jgi:hypothetical protein
MLTINECKNILGTEANGLTDDDIIQIREWFSILADIAIDTLENNNCVREKS